MKYTVEVQADDKIVYRSRQCFSFLNSEAQGFYLFIESVCEQRLEREHEISPHMNPSCTFFSLLLPVPWMLLLPWVGRT